MENKDTQLIRRYMNLMESIETKIISEEKSIVINEDLLASAAREGKLLASELEGFLKMMKQDSKISSELVKSGIRDAEELLLALKGNKLNAVLKGSLELNILKSQTTNSKLIDLASENLSRNQQFLQKYSNEIKQGQPQFEAALKKSGYSNRAITKIVEKSYLKKSSGLQTVAAKNKQLVGNKKPTDPSFTSKIKNWTKTKGEELKKLLKSGKNWKKILAWGLGLGIPAVVLYWMIKDSGETIPQDLPPTPPTDSEWSPCIQNLINDKSGVVAVSPSGEISVLVTKTGNSEYDKAGGLKFYSNGRVWSNDNIKKGSWTCKGGEAQTNEMSLNEQTSSEIDSDVETMIDLLDFPVTSNDMQDALVMLKKYSTSPKGKEFLQSYKDAGIGGGSLKKSVSYITTTKASSSRAKREMLSLISQIESGKTTSPTPTTMPTTGGGIGNINITWDGEKTAEPVTPDVKSSEGTKNSSGSTRKSRFTDRNKFPYSIGHRSPIIKEIQICFGFPKKWQTGNFGPITLKKLRDLYGVSEINEYGYNLIKEKCKLKPTTGTTANTGTTVNTGTTTTSTTQPITTSTTQPTTTSTTQPTKTPLTRENCEKLFKEILKRDDKNGGRTATDEEIAKCQKCLQQYNFGIGQGASKIKRAYALTSSGGNKGIRK